MTLSVIMTMIRSCISIRSTARFLLFSSAFALLCSKTLCENVNHENPDDDDVDFPPLLDSDDIAYFFEENDLDGLHWALANVFARSERNPTPHPKQQPLSSTLVSRGGGSTYTSEYKLRCDLEQAQHIAEVYQSTDKEKSYLFANVISPMYEAMIKRVPPLDQLQRTEGLYPFKPNDLQNGGMSEVYNKALHHTDIDEYVVGSKQQKSIDIVNPNLNVEAIQQQWEGTIPPPDGIPGAPGVVVVDDILTNEALERIRKVMLESTVFYQTKMPLKFGGYVGAYIDDGLYDRILLKLAFELHKALPRIMKNHPLRYLWAYKYDSDFTGINTHADQAAVNVNLWLTPDDANLDMDSGGLVVFTTKPPEDWDFERFNKDTELIEQLVKPGGHGANVTVPHRQNRAVIFDSALFHHSDAYKFKKGYKNRRINLTLLYGNMQRGGTDSSTATVDATASREL